MNKLEHLLFLLVIYLLFIVSCTVIWYSALKLFIPALPFRLPISVSNSILTIYLSFPPKATLKKMQEDDDDD